MLGGYTLVLGYIVGRGCNLVMGYVVGHGCIGVHGCTLDRGCNVVLRCNAVLVLGLKKYMYKWTIIDS